MLPKYKIPQVLNFKTEFVSPTDRSWGSRSANGSYNGMMGMLQRQDNVHQ